MLLGLCGYAGVGKDTAAQILLEEFGFQRIAFADPMKQALLALDPLIPTAEDPQQTLRLSAFAAHTPWSALKEHAEVRRLLQVLGTEVGRNLFDTDLWVKLAERKLESTLAVGHAVFTDVRFPNEARLIRRYGGFLVRLERPGFGPVNEHLSDRASIGWTYDHRLENSSDVPTLHRKMKELVSELLQTEQREKGELS